MTRQTLNVRALKKLQSGWAEKLKNEYEGLSTAKDLIRFLEDDDLYSAPGFELVSFLQDNYGQAEGARCRIEVDGLSGVFTPYGSLPDTSIPEKEIYAYARLMARLAALRGMADQFPAKAFLPLLRKQKTGLSRESCFQMSFALGMDWESTCHFLAVMGQPPYQFRVLEECIYYVCQISSTMNRWDAARSFLTACRDGSLDRRERPLYAGQTQSLEWTLTELAETADAAPTEEERRSIVLDFMADNAPLMHGLSLSSHRLFVEKLESVKALLGVTGDQEAAIAMWSPIWIQYSRKSRTPGREDNENPGAMVKYDFLPFRNLVHLPKTLYEKPLWRARIRELRNAETSVEKRDILFLCLMEWMWSGEECGGAENMHRFLQKTNAALTRGGLPMIYPPDRYDRMILLSVCSKDPLDVLADIFEASTSEEELLRHLIRSAPDL